MDILLHDARLFRRLRSLTNDILKLVPVFGDLDTHTAISALTRFGYPNVLDIAMLIVVLLEGEEVGVTKTILDMERNRQCAEGILANRLIIVLHVHEQGLLVAQVVVVLNLVRQLDGVDIEWL